MAFKESSLTARASSSGVTRCPHLYLPSVTGVFLSLSARSLYLTVAQSLQNLSYYSCLSQFLLRALSKFHSGDCSLISYCCPRCPPTCCPSSWIWEDHCSQGSLCCFLSSTPLGAWLAGPQCQMLSWFRSAFCTVLYQIPDTQPHLLDWTSSLHLRWTGETDSSQNSLCVFRMESPYRPSLAAGGECLV